MPVPLSPYRLCIELELTPSYWLRLAADGLSPNHPEHGKACALLARCLSAALQLGGAQRVVTERTRFAVVLAVPRDVSLESLCHRAGAVREGLEAFDHSFLGSSRSKYLSDG